MGHSHLGLSLDGNRGRKATVRQSEDRNIHGEYSLSGGNQTTGSTGIGRKGWYSQGIIIKIFVGLKVEVEI